MIASNYKITKPGSRRDSLVKDLDNIEYVDILVKYFNQQQVDLSFDSLTNDSPSLVCDSSSSDNSSAEESSVDDCLSQQNSVNFETSTREFQFSFEDQNEIDEINNLNNPYLGSSNLEPLGASDSLSGISFLVNGDDEQLDSQVSFAAAAASTGPSIGDSSTPGGKLNYRCHSDLNLKFNVNVIDKFDSESCGNSDTENESVSSFLDSKYSSENGSDLSEIEDDLSKVCNNDDDGKRFNYVFDENKEVINFFPKKTSSLATALIPDKFISSLVNNSDSYNTSCLLI